MDIPSKYEPQKAENRWYDYWLEHRYFHSEPDDRESYTIVIPPPNVTGVLHMGHMLNNTLQDVLTRRARLMGKNACWVPGTDHASIATEAKVVSGLADAVVEVTETGSTIKAHGLRIIHELMQTNTQLITNRQAWEDPPKREKIEQIALLLKGALLGEKMVGIKMNVPHDKLAQVVTLLPSLNAPTVASLYQSDWFSVETVVGTGVVRDLIPVLLKNGAEGIIEYPLNKVL